MRFRQTGPPVIAAAKAGFGTAAACRMEHDPRLFSQQKALRAGRRRDPLAAVWDSEAVPLLQDTPGLRPITIFDETRRRHPEIGTGIRRTLERRIQCTRQRCQLAPSVTSSSGRSVRRAGPACPISPACASGGFSLKKMFYSVPSRPIGHRPRVRLYDDRLACFLGATALMTLRRGRPHPSGKRGHVVDYRHVVHALRRKPVALLNLVYREQLFPPRAYQRAFEQRAFEALLVSEGEKRACRTIVGLLALAHDRAREADLAAQADRPG